MYTTPLKDHVYIMGTRIKITISDTECSDAEADGLYASEEITLRSHYKSLEEYRRIYTHECFHALHELLGVQLNTTVEEIIAHRVSHMIAYEIF